jgi:hypothetical protein
MLLEIGNIRDGAETKVRILILNGLLNLFIYHNCHNIQELKAANSMPFICLIAYPNELMGHQVSRKRALLQNSLQGNLLQIGSAK